MCHVEGQRRGWCHWQWVVYLKNIVPIGYEAPVSALSYRTGAKMDPASGLPCGEDTCAALAS